MRFEFSEFELAGVIIPVEGYAEFLYDPRENRRHMPTIVLNGYEPGKRSPGIFVTPIAAHLTLGSTGQATGPTQSVLSALNYVIRDWLMTRRFDALCRQWDDEAESRREQANEQAYHFRIDAA